MTHILIQPGSLARPQSAAMAAIGHFVRHLDKTKEWMLRSWYLGAGRLAMVDKYYNLSYQKTIIIIIFLTHPTAWSPLSMHQVKTPSIIPFYNNEVTAIERFVEHHDNCAALSTGQAHVTPGSPWLWVPLTLQLRHGHPSVQPRADAVMASGITGSLEKVTGWITDLSVCSRRPRHGAAAIVSNRW